TVLEVLVLKYPKSIFFVFLCSPSIITCSAGVTLPLLKTAIVPRSYFLTLILPGPQAKFQPFQSVGACHDQPISYFSNRLIISFIHCSRPGAQRTTPNSPHNKRR